MAMSAQFAYFFFSVHRNSLLFEKCRVKIAPSLALCGCSYPGPTSNRVLIRRESGKRTRQHSALALRLRLEWLDVVLEDLEALAARAAEEHDAQLRAGIAEHGEQVVVIGAERAVELEWRVEGAGFDSDALLA